MHNRNHNFPFGIHFNFCTDNLLVIQNSDQGLPTPPAPGNFELLDGTPFLLLDGTNLLLL